MGQIKLHPQNKQLSFSFFCRDGAFCFLIRDFGLHLSAGVLSDWLEGLAGNLERYVLYS